MKKEAEEEQAVDLMPLGEVLEQGAIDVSENGNEPAEASLTAELVQEKLGQPESAPILDIIKKCT